MCASNAPTTRQRRVPVVLRALALACAAAAIGTGVGISPAWAEQQPSREQEQLRRLRQQLQQLQQQQTTDQDAARRAEADKAAAQTTAKAQVESVQAELRRLRGSTAALTKTAADQQKELDALRSERDAQKTAADTLRTELDASKASGAKQQADITGLLRRLAERDSTLTDLGARHATQAQGLQSCMASNQALHAIGLDLLQRYADKGVGEVLAQREPFLQLKRVALENLLQGYQDKLDQQAIQPLATSPVEPGRAP